MSLTPTATFVTDEVRCKQILDKIMPDVVSLLDQIKTDLGGRLPEELSYGIVAGYLHGRGHTWEEAFFGMNRWIQTMERHYPDSLKSLDGSMTLRGMGDGTVKVDVKDGKGEDVP